MTQRLVGIEKRIKLIVLLKLLFKNLSQLLIHVEVSIALGVGEEVTLYNPTADENFHEMSRTETRFSRDKYI